MPRSLAWVRCISQRPWLQTQQSLSHPSVVQRQAGHFPGPWLSCGHEQKTSKRGSSVPLLLLALVNAATHQRSPPAPRLPPPAGTSPRLSPRGAPVAAGWLSHLQQVHKLPGVPQHSAGSCGRQKLGNPSPNSPLCSLKPTFIYAARGGKKWPVPAVSLQFYFSVSELKLWGSSPSAEQTQHLQE